MTPVFNSERRLMMRGRTNQTNTTTILLRPTTETRIMTIPKGSKCHDKRRGSMWFIHVSELWPCSLTKRISLLLCTSNWAALIGKSAMDTVYVDETPCHSFWVSNCVRNRLHA
jgi:hypothetical protein